MRRPSMLAAVVVVATSPAVGADVTRSSLPAGVRVPAVDPAATRAAMEDYYDGEIRGGYVLVGLGLGGLAAGGLLYRSAPATNHGLAYPLLGVGLLHAVAGVYIGLASRRRIDRFTDQIATDPAGFLAEERPRMRRVSRTFTALEIGELTLIAGGLAMAGIGWRTDRPRLAGAGLAVALEAAVTLGFDIWASRRAHGYRDRLAGVDVQAAVDHGTGAPVALIGHAGTF